MDGFGDLVCGSIVLRQCPDGALEKLIVTWAHHDGMFVYEVAKLHEDGSITAGYTVLTQADIDFDEANGYSYSYFLGDVAPAMPLLNYGMKR